MSGQLIGPIGVLPAVAGPSFALTYQASLASGSTTSPITYATAGYAAGATRTICIIQWYGGGTPGITGVTIDGTSLVQVASAFANISTDKSADVWISSVPLAGGAGSVVVTYASNPSFSSAVALYNLTTSAPTAGTPATTVLAAPAATITDGPVTIPTGGGAVFATYPYSGATGSITSGNATIDASPANGGATFYFAHMTATGSQSVTMTYSGNDAGPATLVPWGP